MTFKDLLEHLSCASGLDIGWFGVNRQVPSLSIIFLGCCLAYDRFLTLHHSATRNRLAAISAFVSGILFIISGYEANFELYYLLQEQIPALIQTEEVQLWMLMLDRVGILSILSQLGGIAVLMGAGLFVANRVNIGKLLVIIGTGQGVITIILHILLEIQSGRILSSENNYIIWLTSSATGLGVLFAIISQSFSKGKSKSIISKALGLALRRIRGKRDLVEG